MWTRIVSLPSLIWAKITIYWLETLATLMDKLGPKNGGHALAHSFESMCDRLDFMATTVKKNRQQLNNEQVAFVVKNAYAIEEEWILEPSMRSPRINSDDDEDYLEYFEDG